mmetsp:Transcript_24470/g.40781  ORF Transcript_24470/g.40781 Transcript_24470/m.40781 type:complete len:324 (+) Transcript_24470:739-1710(+)
MDWSPELGLLVTGSNDKALRLSNPLTGDVSEPMKEHNGTIRVARFCSSMPSSSSSSSQALLASAGAGDFIPRLWDAQTAKCIRGLSAHEDSVHGLVWLSDSLLITGCDLGVITAHDLRSPQPAWSYSLNDALWEQQQQQQHASSPATAEGTSKKTRGVCCLSLIPSSAVTATTIPVIAGCTGGHVTMFNAVNGEIYSDNQLHLDDVRSISMMLPPPYSSSSSSAVGRQPQQRNDNITFLTASYDCTAALWSVHANSRSAEYRYNGPPNILKAHGDKVLSATPIISAPSGSGSGKSRDDNRSGNFATDIVTTGADGKAMIWTAT